MSFLTDAIHRAVNTSIPPERHGVQELLATKLIDHHNAGAWSWTRADADVVDAFDETFENVTIGAYESAQIVKAINDRLPTGMQFTVTTSTDRMIRSYA